MLIYIILISAAAFVLYSVYAQARLSPLIDYIRQSPALTKSAGDVSDLYYIFTMPRGNYRFALYLWHNASPPEEIRAHFPDYEHLRMTSNIALLMHIGLGVIIFLTVMFNLTMNI